MNDRLIEAAGPTSIVDQIRNIRKSAANYLPQLGRDLIEEKLLQAGGAYAVLF